jgi:hypothetical protein
MARNKNTDTQDTGFSFDNITVTDSTDVPARAARDEKPNPLLGAVQGSLSDGRWKQLPAIPTDRAKDADNYLRRAAVKLACGIEIRKEETAAGIVVHFRAKHEKRNRAYTVEDVRTWAREMGYDESDLTPKVHRDISNAYRDAHGMKVNKVQA